MDMELSEDKTLAWSAPEAEDDAYTCLKNIAGGGRQTTVDGLRMSSNIRRMASNRHGTALDGLPAKMAHRARCGDLTARCRGLNYNDHANR